MRIVVPASVRSAERTVAWANRRDVSFDGDTALAAPSAYRAMSYVDTVGRGETDFERARTGLQTWAAHRTAGVEVLPRGSTVSVGSTYVVTFGTSLLAIAAPCRVTAILNEPARWGFTCRTLSGHPEEGEESFEIELDDDVVRFSVAARSRAGSRLIALGAPINHLVQRSVTKGYLRALARYVRST